MSKEKITNMTIKIFQIVKWRDKKSFMKVEHKNTVIKITERAKTTIF
jgi:hypothetical protein